MEIVPAKESRRFDRKAHECHVVGRHCDLNGRVRLFSGKTLDISLRGLGVLVDSSDVPFEGDTIDVSLRIYEDEPPIKVTGFVSWCSDEGRGGGEGARVGVELTGMVNPVHSYKRWLEILTWN